MIIQHEWPNELEVSQKFDLIFADPPYNIGVGYEDDPTDDRVSTKEYELFVRLTVLSLRTLLRPGGTLWWLCPAEQGHQIWDIVDHSGLRLLYDRPIIWHERFSQYQQKRLTSDYRLLFPLTRLRDVAVTFNPDKIREPSERQRLGDKRADPRGRVPGHVWRVRRLQGTAKDRVDWHPAQLPPETLERILLGWTHGGDRVLDAFAGSGNMGQVCRKHGRVFVGVDKSPTYCEKMKERIDV